MQRAKEGILCKSGTGPPLYMGTKAASCHCSIVIEREGAAGRQIHESEDLPGHQERSEAAWTAVFTPDICG